MHDTALIDQAVTASRHAYCPYSHFPVGAALLSSDGRVFTGCNIENASFGLTICAERNALAAAVVQGCRSFRTLALVGPTRPSPCGACRQVLTEFVSPDFCILLAAIDAPGSVVSYSMQDLLPHAFSQHDLSLQPPT